MPNLRQTKPTPWLMAGLATVLLLLATAQSATAQQGQNVRFRHVFVEDGLSHEAVHASNNDGLWNEEDLAPAPGTAPWRAWWVILLYVLSVVGAVLAIMRRQTHKLDQQAEYSRRLEQEVANRTDKLKVQNSELE